MIDALQNKVVIVTGGAHGIGRAYCLAFARAGSKIIIADLDQAAAAQVAVEARKFLESLN